MKKNVLYTEFNDEYQYVIDHLSQKYGWNPVLVLAKKHMRDSISEKYQGAIFLESMELREAIFNYDCIGGRIVPIDAKIIRALSSHESFFLDLVEDSTGWNFSFHERKRYYYDLLQFWNTALCHVKPDMYVSWTWPHTVAENILYQLCKYYSIPVLFINPTALLNHGQNKYHYVSLSLEEQSSAFQGIYDANEECKKIDGISEYLASVRSKNGMTPPYIRYYWDNHAKYWNPDFWKKWQGRIKNIFKLSMTGKLFARIYGGACKYTRFPLGSEKSKMNYLQLIMHEDLIRRNDKNLEKMYSRFCVAPDFTKKYIYFAASFQPEAGIWTVYQDQLLILTMLAASIPSDWVIYYKEHPSQFLVGIKGSLCRSEDYYNRISAHRNIHMIPASTDTFKLIDGAQAVGTAGGTVGWESIVRGTPALIFGNVWYQGCRSIFKIETHQDCLNALEKIKNGYKPDPQDVERFSAAVAEVSGKNIIHGDFIVEQMAACRESRTEMERIAELLYDTYSRTYAKSFDEQPKR